MLFSPIHTTPFIFEGDQNTLNSLYSMVRKSIYASVLGCFLVRSPHYLGTEVLRAELELIRVFRFMFLFLLLSF